MNYDGIYINTQVREIRNEILGEHITKITEKSPKEVCFHIRKNNSDLIFSLSADPNFPHILLSKDDTEKFATPPAFCMLLRKYLQGGTIESINTGNIGIKNSLERIVDINIKNVSNEGDTCIYHVIIEIMGRYSNVIITDANYIIIDILIKSNNTEYRLKTKEKYTTENICTKKEILNEDETNFTGNLDDYAGIGKENRIAFNGLSLKKIKIAITNILENKKNINEEVISYINEKLKNSNKSSEIKNIETIIKNLFTKLNKKLDNYKKDLYKCQGFESYKKYGDLVSSFGYSKNLIIDNVLICEDYTNNNEEIKIPIDSDLSIAENINKYYERYNKLKRTKENAIKLIDETTEKIEHLNTIAESCKLSEEKNDIFLIKEELIKYFDETNKVQSLNKQKNAKNVRNNKNKGKLNYNIHHYKSSNGIDIYVGKNNLQNEYLTFTLASPTDTWLHIKNATGSHVIIKKPYEELDDKTLIEAASLAAYFSEKKNETKATVDYTLRKELKKVKGKAPGFCIYHKNYSINVKPEITISEV